MGSEVPDDLESLLSARSSPIFCTDCVFVGSLRRFVPEQEQCNLAAKDRSTVKQFQFTIQESPSSAARCRSCGVKIDKGDLRCGYPVRDSRGEFGVLTAWTHLHCCGLLLRKAISGILSSEELRDIELQGVKAEEEHTEPDGNTGENKIYIVLASLLEGWERVPAAVQRKLAMSALRTDHQADIDEAKAFLETAVQRRVVRRQAAPDDLLVPLLPFQEEGLAWMCEQEEVAGVQGGILADEMGMGKTIQTIALLLARKRQSPLSVGQGASLVVAPLAAVLQWKQEIERFTRENSLRVLLYHGSCRTALLRELHLYDVVITTYATLESDYRQVLNLHKLPCKYCGRMFLPEKLTFHLRYFCGDDATRTARQAMTQKKRERAAEKAMKTLDIQTDDVPEYQTPTITNVFLSILKEAKIEVPVDAVKHIPWLRGRVAALRNGKTAPSSRTDEPQSSCTESTPCEIQEDRATVKDFLSERSDKSPRTSGKKVVAQNARAMKSTTRKQTRNNRLKETSQSSVSVPTPPEDPKKNMFDQLLAMGFPVERVNALLETYDGTDLGQVVECLVDSEEVSIVTGDVSEDGLSNGCSVTDRDTNTAGEHNEQVFSGGESLKLEEGQGPSSRAQEARMLRQQLGLSKTDIQKKKVSELKIILRELGHPSFGTKVELVNRLVLLLFPDEEDTGSSTFPPNAPVRRSDRLDAWTALSAEASQSGASSWNSTAAPFSSETEQQQPAADEPSQITEAPKSSGLKGRAKRQCTMKGKRMQEPPISTRKTRSGVTKKPRRRYSDSSSISDDDGSVASSELSDISSSSSDTTLDTARSRRKVSVPKACGTKKTVKKQNSKGGKKDNVSTTSAVDDDDNDEYSSDVDMSLSPLHTIIWERIILDEAHRIKGRTTSTAKSVYALQCSGARWCLSGTPLQNRVGELYSLVHFLRVKPYAYYYCQKKGCTCASLQFRFHENRFCVQCGHARLSHYAWFNRTIVTPIKNYGCSKEGREGLRVLKDEVLGKLLLRRTKLERASDVKLPPLTVLIRRDPLIPAERDFYDSLYKQTKTQFNTYVQQGTVLHNYAHIFDLLSRLRQAVDHPYLIVYGNLAPSQSVLQKNASSSTTTYQRDICWLCQDGIEDTEEICVTACHHTFHRSCLQQYTASAPEDPTQESSATTLGCPKCFRALTVDGLLSATSDSQSTQHNDTDVDSSRRPRGPNPEKRAAGSGILSRINVAEFTSSTKIEALVQELETIEKEDPEAKSIVFSQYTAMLDLIEWRLKKGSVPCVKLVGSLSLESRSNILYAFTTDPALKVILMSLKAGGEGLNLQVANHIFLMDPWWNPATEMQAIQRAHRIGQRKAVRAIRFICEGTIEEKMLQLQEKKQLIFDGTVGASDAAMAKLTAEDLRFLFQN